MIPVFFICFVIFSFTFAHTLRKSNADQKEVEANFWERERLANEVRKQDISELNYISIPLEKFPLNLGSPAEEQLKELSQQRILNLTGISNTQLKEQYGAANLETLSTYDNNFTTLVNTLTEYAEELLAANKTEEATHVLEYAVSILCDSRKIYVMLANIYKDHEETDKISTLIASANSLQSISKTAIIHDLEAIA